MLQNYMYERNRTLSISTSLLSMFFRDNYGTVPAYQLTCSNTTRINYSTLLYEKTQRDFSFNNYIEGLDMDVLFELIYNITNLF